MKNIDGFNLMASHVLLALLVEFPKPLILDAQDFQDAIEDLPEDCKWDNHVYGNLAACTIRYLVDEGYIRAQINGSSLFSQTVLTAKGFSALNRKLDALEPGKTLAQRLKEAGKSIAPEVASAIVARFLEVVL